MIKCTRTVLYKGGTTFEETAQTCIGSQKEKARHQQTHSRQVASSLKGVCYYVEMRFKKLPPVSVLKENFKYSRETGQLIRKAKRFTNKCLVGKPAGCLSPDGYIRVSVNNCLYLAHRIIWAMHDNNFDERMLIDHVDGDRSNNRLENLRPLSHQDNLRAYNKAKLRSNYGIWWRKDIKKWRAGLKVNGRSVFLGQFAKRSQAKKAVQEHLAKIT